VIGKDDCGQYGQLANDGELPPLPTALQRARGVLRRCSEDHNKHRSTRYNFWGQPPRYC